MTRIVLVVEDDAATAELERRTLMRAGFEVRVAAGVQESLALLAAEETFCAVLLDYHLPDGDPWGVVERAVAREARIPVVVVTAAGTERAAAEALQHGAADYVVKTESFWDSLPLVVNRVVRLAQTEDRLRQSDAMFRLIAENTSDVIVVTNGANIIKYISPNCRRIFGYEPEELVGVSTIELLHPEDIAVATVDQTIATDKQHWVIRARHKDGQYLWIESSSFVVREQTTSAIKEIISVVRDISERMRAAALLEQANRDLDAFAERVAHDLRGPLTSLLLAAGYLHTLARSPGDEIEQLATRIQRTARRAEQMTIALLDFSRAGGAPDATSETRVATGLQEAVEALRPQADEAGVSLEVRADDAAIRCRPELFYVLVMNLLSNSIKFLGGREVRTVRLSTRVEGPWSVLTVEDTGPGIRPEDHKRIFDRFYRVPGNSAPGSGIGLSTVQRIVTACHGRIEVASVVDQGTTFRVWIPLATPEPR